jgi:hypothetical protein
MNRVYLDTARLLTQVAPAVFAGRRFALKGGTAINLFKRDMPRLSVDLDLVFIDHRTEREAALAIIEQDLRSAAALLGKRGFQTRAAADTSETKLLVERDGIQVKVEVNYVMRGTLHPVRQASLAARARETLMADLELPVVSLEDLYGGKLVAAMDRQHPRDLFDVMQLYLNEGITPGIRRAFVAYLACHNRPIHEVLFPSLRDISLDYRNTFQGMTAEPVALDALLHARGRMIADLQAGLDSDERSFLLSLARNETDFALLGIEHLGQLPGMRWKVLNLDQLARANPKKLKAQAQELEELLERK